MARLSRFHADRLKKKPVLRKSAGPSRDKVAAAMLSGRPLPLSYLTSPKDKQPAAIPPATLRKLDIALQRIADQHPARPVTHWSFIPRAGMVVEVRTGHEVVWAKMLDWNEQTGGATVASRAGELKVALKDLRPVSAEELARAAKARAEREEHDQEAAAVRLSRFTIDDVEVGMRLEVEGPTPNETYSGKVVHIDRGGQYLVIKAILIDGRQAVPGYVACRFDQIRGVPDSEGNLS